MLKETIFYVVLALYSGFLSLVGVYYFRKVKTINGYLLADRKVGLWDTIFTTSATFTGSIHFIGLVGISFLLGIAGFWYGIFLSLGILFWGALAAGKVRKLKLYTIGDIFSRSRNGKVQSVASFFYLLRNVALVIVEFMGVGLVVATLTEIPYAAGVIIGGSIIIFYTIMGGLWPVIKSDAIQLLLIFVAFGILLVTGLANADFKSLPPSFFNIWNIEPMAIVGLALTCIPLAWTVPPLYDRACCAKDETTAKKGIFIGGILLIFPFSILPVIIGISARTIVEVNANPETAGLLLALKMLPSPLIAILAVCILAVIMSTIDSFLMSSGGIITRNFYYLSKKDADSPEQIAITRLAIATVGIVAMFIAMFLTSILETFLLSIKIIVSTLFIPTALELYLPEKAYPQRVIMSMILGATTAIIWTLLGSPLKVDPVIPGIIASIIGCYISKGTRC